MDQDAQSAFKRDLYDQFARIGQALASGPRIELLELLSQTERTVEELTDQTGLSVGLLTRKGFRARRLTVGLPDWRASGLPVDATAKSVAPRPQGRTCRASFRAPAKG